MSKIIHMNEASSIQYKNQFFNRLESLHVKYFPQSVIPTN